MAKGYRLLILFFPPLFLVVTVGFSSLTVWFDRVVYDFLAIHYQAENIKSDEIVIIDIDQASLQRLSSWPLKRSVHAAVITELTTAEASAIAYNVAFISPVADDPIGDDLLLRAIEKNGRVVLPLIAEGGKELGPLGRTDLAGADLGHADLSVDSDGLFRRSYLHAGIAFPRWPSFSLATLHTFAPVKADDFSGLRSPYLHVGFSKRWSRDYELFLPLGIQQFAENVERYSLWQIIEGSISHSRLRNKAVFIGVNEPHLETELLIGENQFFSSTEIHAFIFHALNRGFTLTPSLPIWAIIIGLLMTLSWGVVLINVSFGTKLLALSISVAIAFIPFWLLQLGYWVSFMPMLTGVASVSMIFLLKYFSVGGVNKKALS